MAKDHNSNSSKENPLQDLNDDDPADSKIISRLRPAWARADLHADFTKRVVWHSDTLAWQTTQSEGVSVKAIEIVGDLERPRFTALLKMQPDTRYQLRYHDSGTELLVLEGSLNPRAVTSTVDGSAPYNSVAGHYLRFPLGSGDVPLSLIHI